jgi:periplasmic copper chaperone A
MPDAPIAEKSSFARSFRVSTAFISDQNGWNDARRLANTLRARYVHRMIGSGAKGGVVERLPFRPHAGFRAGSCHGVTRPGLTVSIATQGAFMARFTGLALAGIVFAAPAWIGLGTGKAVAQTTPGPSGHGSQTAQAASPMVFKAGALAISAPWMRATPGGAKVAGGYMRITNTGSEPDRLTGGSLPIAGRVEVHEMATANNVMVMRQLEKGLEIRPGETVELKPGGFHVMFMELQQPVRQGAPLVGTLVFENAGTVQIEYHVAPIGALSPGTGAGGGHSHH